MEEILTKEEMQQADFNAINKYKIPSIVLMENAAMSFFNEIKDYSDKFLIFASTGNNGGDALAIARHLILNGKCVKTVITGVEEKMSPDCRKNYEILLNLNADIRFLKDLKFEDLKSKISDSVVLDGIFGTGLSRNIEGKYRDLINFINEFSKYTIAVDIPSGIDATTGEVLGVAIKADKTITFHRMKKGLTLAEKSYVGVVSVKYIGIPFE